MLMKIMSRNKKLIKKISKKSNHFGKQQTIQD